MPVRGRVGLELPEGWKAETAEVVEWDDREQESPPHRFTFTVTPSSPLETQRFEMQAVVSGTGRMLPFRKTMPVVVGHDFIKEWMIVGPFPNDRGEGFDHIYPPELNIKVDETYESLGKTIAWQKKAFPTGYIDLDSIMTPNDRVMAYAYVGIYSPRDQRVWLEVGADEGIKIFHNYKEIFSKRHTALLQPGTDRVPAHFYQGWNHIVVKVQDSVGTWGFYFEATDLFGRRLPDLRFAFDRAS
ncbi:MAG: hypothetical protein A3G75_14565 [Verrucomicrobia bacterium RIFCSPLOWO2_12_FULL_64_8]|nr:MAG: hypothetical protein A3G75_14565 [Verrucomicrobia bacterium RIFCSPLOWO2_12_FULL_64_8]